MRELTTRAAEFRQLHERMLVLPNAWDAASARIIEKAGAAAIATTSAAVSWALGYPDSESLTRNQMLEVVRNIVRTVNVPVSADVEAGYGGHSPADVAHTVRDLIELGVAGMNIEDSTRENADALLDVESQVQRIAAARDVAGAEFVINARIDMYLMEIGEPKDRFAETVRRARGYRAAGADCIFVPGVVDAPTISSLAREIQAPLNVMAGPGAPSVAALAKLGVARVSVGPAVALVALGATQRAAQTLLQDGTYDGFVDALPFPDVNDAFKRS